MGRRERRVYMFVCGAGVGREEWERKKRRRQDAALLAPGHNFQALALAVILDVGPPQVTSCHATAPKATAQL